VKLFAHQLRAEQKLFWRSREAAVFIFAFPVLLYVLLASVYSGKVAFQGVRVPTAEYLLGGMIGYGAANTAFAGIAITLVIRREDGLLKRLRATPLPAPAYVAALLSAFLAAFAVEVVGLLAIGRAFFSVPLPHHALSLALALLLGAVSFCGLGIGLTGLIKSAEGASAVVNAIYLPVAFISGSFFSPHSYPRFLRAIADVLPLTYFLRLIRNVMLHGHEIWSQGTNVAVVAAWGIAGLIVAIRSFRWEPTEG